MRGGGRVEAATHTRGATDAALQGAPAVAAQNIEMAIQLLDTLFSTLPPARPPSMRHSSPPYAPASQPSLPAVSAARADEREEDHEKFRYFSARGRYLYGWALVAAGDRIGGEAVLRNVAEEHFLLPPLQRTDPPPPPLLPPPHADLDLLAISAAAWGTLGLLYERDGDWAEAERLLQIALAAALSSCAHAHQLASGAAAGGGYAEQRAGVEGGGGRGGGRCGGGGALGGGRGEGRGGGGEGGARASAGQEP